MEYFLSAHGVGGPTCGWECDLCAYAYLFSRVWTHSGSDYRWGACRVLCVAPYLSSSQPHSQRHRQRPWPRSGDQRGGWAESYWESVDGVPFRINVHTQASGHTVWLLPTRVPESTVNLSFVHWLEKQQGRLLILPWLCVGLCSPSCTLTFHCRLRSLHAFHSFVLPSKLEAPVGCHFSPHP